MNASIINFLNDGTIHPTRASHRTAAKAYHAYVLDQKNASSNSIIQLTPTQVDALTMWDPSKPPHLPPIALTDDNIFAHFLIHTLKQIIDELFNKPTLRARQG